MKKMTRLLESMAAEFGLLAEENSEIETNTINTLDRARKMDEVDTVTFGLETDDDKIVKVYVNAEQANDFEKALSDKLGECDDIEEALNELVKDFDIIDVEWPNEKKEDEDPFGEDGEDESGSSALDPKIYDSAKNREEMEDELMPKLEHLNVGEKATLKLLEADATTIESRLNTASQLMVYHAMLDLGFPEVAMNRNPYRALIIKGIREKALELNKNVAMKQALKMFISRSTSDLKSLKKHDDKHDEKHDDKHDVRESIDPSLLMEGVSQDFWTAIKSIIKYISPDEAAAENLLSSSKMEQLMARSSSSIQTKVTSQLRSKLNDLVKAMEIQPAGDVVAESATFDEVSSLLGNLLSLADSTDDGRQVKAITSSTQYNQLMLKVKTKLSQKFTGPARNKLNMVKAALSAAMSAATPKTDKPVIEQKLIEDHVKWTFENGDDGFKITGNKMSVTIDEEAVERLIKGMVSRAVVIVKDIDEPSMKVSFSPRGTQAQVKRVGDHNVLTMSSKDIDKMLDELGKVSKKDAEEAELVENIVIVSTSKLDGNSHNKLIKDLNACGFKDSNHRSNANAQTHDFEIRVSNVDKAKVKEIIKKYPGAEILGS